MKATNQTYQREYNRALVLKLLRSKGPLGRADIARHLDLKKSSIGTIVAGLLEEGIICTLGADETFSAGGRKPVLIELNYNFGCVLGLELRPSAWKAVLMNLKGDVFWKKKAASPYAEDFLSLFLTVISILRPSIDKTGLPLVAVSAGIPGWVNPGEGLIKLSHAFKIKEYSFRKEAEEALHLPVFIENDANCGAWGEMLLGRPDKIRNFLFLLTEYQPAAEGSAEDKSLFLGFGIVLNGRLYYGENFGSGEFRSVFWQKNRIFQTGLSDEEMRNVSDDSAIFRRYIKEVLTNLSNLVALLDISAVIVGGEVVHEYSVITDVLESELKDSWIGINKNLFCTAGFKDYAVAGGAASMIIEKLYQLPVPDDEIGSLSWEQLLNKNDKF